MENDGLNRLVLKAGLGWREVVVLRTLCKYLRQTGIAYGQAYMEDTLARYHGLAHAIVALFRARFDPNRDPRLEPQLPADRQAAFDQLDQTFIAGLEAVESLDDDRILRRFRNLVHAALRTNFYQRGEGGGPKAYPTIKFDSRLVDELPLP